MKKTLIISLFLLSVVTVINAQPQGKIVETSNDAYYLTETGKKIPAKCWLQGFARDRFHQEVIETGLIPTGRYLIPYAVVDGKYVLGEPLPPIAPFTGAAFDENGKIVPCIVKDYGSHAVGYLSADGELLDYWPNI